MEGGRLRSSARSSSQIGVFLHTGFSGFPVVGVSLLNISSGADTFFIHGADQDEYVRIVLKYQRAFQCLYQIVAVFVVKISLGQLNRPVVWVNGLTLISDSCNGDGFVG